MFGTGEDHSARPAALENWNKSIKNPRIDPSSQQPSSDQAEHICPYKR